MQETRFKPCSRKILHAVEQLNPWPQRKSLCSGAHRPQLPPLRCNYWSLSRLEPAQEATTMRNQSPATRVAPQQLEKSQHSQKYINYSKREKKNWETKMNNTLCTWMQATKERKGIFMPVTKCLVCNFNYYIYDTIHNIFTNTNALTGTLILNKYINASLLLKFLLCWHGAKNAKNSLQNKHSMSTSTLFWLSPLS